MVTDGLETNQPGSQDLCPETSRFTYVCVDVLVCICVYVECVCHTHVSFRAENLCGPYNLIPSQRAKENSNLVT